MFTTWINTLNFTHRVFVRAPCDSHDTQRPPHPHAPAPNNNINWLVLVTEIVRISCEREINKIFMLLTFTFTVSFDKILLIKTY